MSDDYTNDAEDVVDLLIDDFEKKSKEDNDIAVVDILKKNDHNNDELPLEFSVKSTKKKTVVDNINNIYKNFIKRQREGTSIAGNDNVLDKICNDKLLHIKRQKELVTEKSLVESLLSVDPPRGFLSSINKKLSNNQNALIAEIKKASPSKGVIRQDFNPEFIASQYEQAGACCISVLTDQPYFQGRDEYLNIVHRACNLPILRKDFILDTYQVIESRALGADCILLIMAALELEKAIELEQHAIRLGMDVLIEVHNEQELENALKMQSKLIGINNRDLKTLNIDLATTEKLSKLIDVDKILVCESGIYTNADILRMNKIDVKTFLVGESLMSKDNIKQATNDLLGV